MIRPLSSIGQRRRLRTPVHRVGAVAAALLLTIAACGTGEGGAAERGEGSLAADIVINASDTLRAGDQPVLAIPFAVSVTSDGGYAVADLSDKNVKLYAPDGQATGAASRPGKGQGEVMQLMGGGVFRDSLFAVDFASLTLSIHSRDGRFVRQITLPGAPNFPMPSDVRVVDDSLFLVSGYPVGHPDKALIRLVRPDGSVKAEFFQRAAHFAGQGEMLAQLTTVVADARDGVVYAALTGDDSVYAYTYTGAPLATGVLATERGQPLADLRTLMARNGHSELSPDSSRVDEGAVKLLNIVALDARRAIAQYAPVRIAGSVGVDPSSGGTLAALMRGERGRALRLSGHRLTPGLLMGRRGDGVAMLLQFLADDGSVVQVSDVRLVEQAPGRAP